MRPEAIFLIDLALGYLVATLLVLNYFWPKLRSMEPQNAHRLLATIHSFRYFGLSFLLTGFVGAALPKEFAAPAAFGDLAASLFAIATLLTYRSPKAFWPLAWLFNIVGILDLLFDTATAVRLNIPAVAGQLGGGYAIIMVYVPFLFVSHVAGLALLVRTIRVPVGETQSGTVQSA